MFIVMLGSGATARVTDTWPRMPRHRTARWEIAEAVIREIGGIRVNVVTPGFIATSLAEERIELIRQNIGGVPLGRWEPADTVRDYGSIVSWLICPSRSVNLNCRSATRPGKLPSR